MKKSVLFVINTISKAGAEMALLELLERFDAQHFDVSLYVIMAQGELIFQIPSHVRILNREISVDSVLTVEGKSHMKRRVLRCALRNFNFIKRLPYLAGNYLRMKRKGDIREDKLLWRILADGCRRQDEVYDLAIAYLEGGSTYYVADYVKAKKKAAFVHIDYQLAGYCPQLDMGCYECFDRIFAVSGEVRESFLKVYPEYEEKTDTFENIINQEKIRDLSRKGTGFDDGFCGIRLLSIGRLTYQKGFDIAIEAMRIIKSQTFRRIRWYVLGDGKLRDELKSKIHETGLDEDFVLLGAVDNPYPYLTQCDLYVHATRFEGKSIAIREALTLGCCVIASDVSGNREQIVDGKNGVLCELSPEGIAQKVSELLAYDTYRMRLKSGALTLKADPEKELMKLFSLVE